MLTASGITKSYDDLQILKGINLSIQDSEVVSIVGASGAGKTTLLQILGTLDRPDQGEVIINGIHPFNLSAKKLSAFRNRSVGFVFQFHQLLPEFTALENIALPALIKGLNHKDATTEAGKLLDLLGLADRAKHMPNQLSGGERQGVVIARAMYFKSKVLILDEPTNHLSVKETNKVLRFVEGLKKQGVTSIFITHNLSHVYPIADHLCVMARGEKIADMAKEDTNIDELTDLLVNG